MKLYFMKQSALDYLKANIKTLYINYYRNDTNQWIYDLFDYDPFEFFIEVSDIVLAPIPDGHQKGTMEMENCKIIYTKLFNISESQAADERLWAGLCNGVFYKYVRERWDYPNRKLKNTAVDASNVLSRFFFSGGTRAGLYRNTLAKCWWIGKMTYQPNQSNKFELLDSLGSDDFATKVSDLFYSNTFSSNPTITKGICKGWKIFSDNGIKLTVKEYFRPALQYMNAYGGGIILDALSEDEIKDVFFDFIQQLRNDENNAVVINIEDDTSEDIEVTLGESIKQMRDANKEIEAPVEKVHVKTIGEKREEAIKNANKIMELKGKPEKVDFETTVTVVRVKTGELLVYNIPPENKPKSTWYTIQIYLLNKKINDVVNVGGQDYKVILIEW